MTVPVNLVVVLDWPFLQLPVPNVNGTVIWLCAPSIIVLGDRLIEADGGFTVHLLLVEDDEEEEDDCAPGISTMSVNTNKATMIAIGFISSHYCPAMRTETGYPLPLLFVLFI
jgi:CRISPR/Cas system CMR subunit Cmr4 (Cas7 group RAMP superfamily)